MKKTFMEHAEMGHDIKEFKSVCEEEGIELKTLLEEVSSGRCVIISSHGRGKPVAIGSIARSKVLCNIGTSSKFKNIRMEVQKAKIAIKSGAKIICDQSVGDDIELNRGMLLEKVGLPIASVPLYQNVDEAKKLHSDPLSFSDENIIATFEKQIQLGVTAPGIPTMSKDLIKMLERNKRLIPIVSRGGGIMHQWIKRNNKDNPYLRCFNNIIDIARKYNVPITFISSLRSGTVVDGFDKCQRIEWEILRSYVGEAHNRKVQIMVDGLGHMALDQIPKAVKYFKRTCKEIPLGVLGPAVTDRGLGNEHIVNAIGTAVAIWNGANYCNACYRTEHIGLPELQDIHEGICASVLAVYTGDLARKDKKTTMISKEREMSTARKKNQWGIMLNNAIDVKNAKNIFDRVGRNNKVGNGCSICGDLCPFVLTGQIINKK